MSGTAMTAGEATIGLVPRYLRPRDAEESAQAAETGDEATNDPFASREMPMLPARMAGNAITNDMRRRIAEAAMPERKGRRPMWFGVAAVAAVLVVGLVFPDTVMALLPGADAAVP
jgi:hypothetical protein